MTPAIRTAAALLLVAAALVARAMRTPAPRDADAPATEFSVARAMRHVRAIADAPHPSGSATHAAVRAHLLSELRAMGLEPRLQEATAVGTRYPAAGRVVNVLARIPGTAGDGKAVLLASHYDGVWAAPAASDDGAGTGAMLETLRALRAGPPLRHDVIALFTDAEESGLLGAAAFVREHPWAKDAEVLLNFEARGTHGRAVMFETGAGNLDVARELARLDDVSAGSLMVTVYRMLPNDTDLSELSQLGKPALNFAFVDGVERYHTAHDDVAHLSPGSLQHLGDQMLALARAFGDGPLPRPASADALFFDLPFVGLVTMPIGWGTGLAALAAIAVLLVVGQTVKGDERWGRGLALGAAGLALAAGIGALLAWRVAPWIVELHATRGWDGAPSWRGVYAAALALLGLAVAAAVWALLRRWASATALHAGALFLMAALASLAAWRVPGASYVLTVPLFAVAFAEWLARRGDSERGAAGARWAGTLVAASLLVPQVFTTGGYTLPLDGLGGIVVGFLVPVTAWLLAPHLEAMGGRHRWMTAGSLLAASVVTFASGMVTVRRSVAFPTAANLSLVANAESDTAWLTSGATGLRAGTWTAASLGEPGRTVPRREEADSALRWMHDARGVIGAITARPIPLRLDGAPAATVLTDTIVGTVRRLTVRVTAPTGTLATIVRGPAWWTLREVDGRLVARDRYRRPPSALSLPFTAPPDSGFVAVLELPRDSAAVLQLAAVAPGLPTMPSVSVPPRPAGVVPVQNGDVTVRYRQVTLP